MQYNEVNFQVGGVYKLTFTDKCYVSQCIGISYQGIPIFHDIITPEPITSYSEDNLTCMGYMFGVLDEEHGEEPYWCISLPHTIELITVMPTLNEQLLQHNPELFL